MNQKSTCFFIVLCCLISVGGYETISPADVFFEIIDPPELEFTYRIRPAKDFGSVFDPNFCMRNTKLVPMIPLDGCKYPVNDEKLRGNVAFVERGECSFVHKTIAAQNAGALAIIITEKDSNESWDTAPDQFIEMVDDRSDREPSIPAAFLLGRSGGFILRTLKMLKKSHAVINLPVNMTYVPISKMNQPPWVSW